MHFTQTLTYWYSINKRNLPWRDTKDPYKIWLSEIILQQTQIHQGWPYYEVFLKAFPTIQHLAGASEDQVLKLWQGLGYYSRARNLHATAKYIAGELHGIFPETYDELLKLKGIGDYTASAVASICFDLPTAVVDGNVYRLLSRYFGINTPVNSSEGIREFKKMAQKLIDIENPGDYNQAVMEFGAIQCKPANPDCLICPLQTTCIANKEDRIEQLPVKIKKGSVKKKYFNYIVLVSEDGKTSLEQRKGKGIWQNLYQFPLIESHESISDKELMKNDSFKKLMNHGTAIPSLYNKKDIQHKLSHQHLFTKFWIVNVKEIKEASVSISTIRNYPVPTLISNFIEEYSF